VRKFTFRPGGTARHHVVDAAHNRTRDLPPALGAGHVDRVVRPGSAGDVVAELAAVQPVQRSGIRIPARPGHPAGEISRAQRRRLDACGPVDRRSAEPRCRASRRPARGHRAGRRQGRSGAARRTGRRLRGDRRLARERQGLGPHPGVARRPRRGPGRPPVRHGIPRDQPRHDAALRPGPRAWRVDRGSDRADRARVHVRDAGAIIVPIIFAAITIPTTLGECGSWPICSRGRPTSRTWSR
jgi:hypothetical protein